MNRYNAIKLIAILVIIVGTTIATVLFISLPNETVTQANGGTSYKIPSVAIPYAITISGAVVLLKRKPDSIQKGFVISVSGLFAFLCLFLLNMK